MTDAETVALPVLRLRSSVVRRLWPAPVAEDVAEGNSKPIALPYAVPDTVTAMVTVTATVTDTEAALGSWGGLV